MFEDLANWLATQVIHYGYWIAFVITLLENAAFVGLVVPGESTLVLVGFFSHGHLSISGLIAAAAAGAIIGDNLSYFFGRHGGRPFVQRLEKRFPIFTRRLEQSQAYFKSHGGKTVFTGRFIGFIRTFVPFTAGVARMSYGRFFIFNLVGAILQVTMLLLIGYFFGAHWEQLKTYFTTGGIVVLVVLGIIFYVVWRRHRARKLGEEP